MESRNRTEWSASSWYPRWSDDFCACQSDVFSTDDRQRPVGILHESLRDIEIARRFTRGCDDTCISTGGEIHKSAEAFLGQIIHSQGCLMNVKGVGLCIKNTVRNATRED